MVAGIGDGQQECLLVAVWDSLVVILSITEPAQVLLLCDPTDGMSLSECDLIRVCT
jgi:hypothetical protein